MFPSSETGSVFPTQELGDILWYEIRVAQLIRWDHDILPIGQGGEFPWRFEPIPYYQTQIDELEASIEELRSMDDLSWEQRYLSEHQEDAAFVQKLVRNVPDPEQPQYLGSLKGNRSLVAGWQPSDPEHIDLRSRILGNIDAQIEQELSSQESFLSRVTESRLITREGLVIMKESRIAKLAKSLKRYNYKLKNAERKAKKMTKFIQSLRTSLGLPLEP